MSIEIQIPRWSDSNDECSLVKWLKAKGDIVSKGEAIAEVETDKATVELEAPTAGVLEPLVDAGAALRVGDVVALVNEAQPQPAAVETTNQRFRPPASLKAPETESRPAAIEAHSDISKSPKVLATPLAQRMAQLAGIDLNTIAAKSGRQRISRTDVEMALGIARKAEIPALNVANRAAEAELDKVTGGQTRVSTLRKTIARRMTESKQTTPHFYLSIDCSVDALLEMRSSVNDASDEAAIPVTPFLVRAVALALQHVPAVNASWTDGAIVTHERIDVSVAVATERGLMTPVIRDAPRKGVMSIASELNELTTRAREGRLVPSEYEGGTFTVSNLGMYGVQSLYAIINPPQSCILGVGASEERPIVRDHQVVIATMFTVTLSADHRLLDGATGAGFLGEFKALIQSPLKLLI